MAKRRPRPGPIETLFRTYQGSLTKLARELGITVSAISQWRKVPVNRVLEIERITGISRHVLRPDLYGGVASAPKKRKVEAVAA